MENTTIADTNTITSEDVIADNATIAATDAAIIKARGELLTEHINSEDPTLKILPAMIPSAISLYETEQSLDAVMSELQGKFNTDIAVGTTMNIVDLTPGAENLKTDTNSVTLTKVKSEDGKTIKVTMEKKKKKPQSNELVELDVSPLFDKFNGNKPKNKPKNINPNQQPTMKQKAVLLVPANRQATSYLQKAFGNSNEGTDGIDHINISSAAQTDLGKFLDIDARYPFVHRELAMFASIGGLWFYIKGEEQNESFRTVFGDHCRFMGKKIKTRNVEGFKIIIADATWMKIISSDRAVHELVESTLPFKNYYYQGILKISKTNYDAIWYTQVIEEIRRTLKLRASTGSTDLMPDFFFLEDN